MYLKTGVYQRSFSVSIIHLSLTWHLLQIYVFVLILWLFCFNNSVFYRSYETRDKIYQAFEWTLKIIYIHLAKQIFKWFLKSRIFSAILVRSFQTAYINVKRLVIHLFFNKEIWRKKKMFVFDICNIAICTDNCFYIWDKNFSSL